MLVLPLFLAAMFGLSTPNAPNSKATATHGISDRWNMTRILFRRLT